MDEAKRKEISLYMQNANEALSVASLNLSSDYISAAVNRAYYAIFYAANAVLATKNFPHSKHSGVIAAFRQYFVKTGVLSSELSDIYGQIMEDRHVSDYELISDLSRQDAQLDIDQASYFVDEVKKWLEKEGWL
jgi:uncharacterized protein (UPF0332 family)